ncbi:MAG: segregation/condensation protein A [Halobacteriovoraceae bacterium]|nr:segregation/condensation protein A [Halobacteriovoraceae bacterium]
MLNKDIIVHVDHFDGPLALLLYLIQKEEMDIEELDLTKITGQYLNYLEKMKELNFDLAGEYLFMASTLTYLKSEKSLDMDKKAAGEEEVSEFDIQTKQQLIQKLKELEKFQKVGNGLWTLPKLGEETFARPKLDKKEHFPPVFKDMSLTQLTGLMIDFLKREKRKFAVINKEKRSIKARLLMLKEKLKMGSQYRFNELITEEDDNALEEIVMTFISLLELARLRRIELFQPDVDTSLYVTVVRDLNDFNVEEASGFEDEEVSEKVEAVLH